MKPTQMIEKHRLVILVERLRLIPRNNPNENLSLGLDPGGYVLLEQLDNPPDLLNVAPEEPGTTHLA